MRDAQLLLSMIVWRGLCRCFRLHSMQAVAGLHSAVPELVSGCAVVPLLAAEAAAYRCLVKSSDNAPLLMYAAYVCCVLCRGLPADSGQDSGQHW